MIPATVPFARSVPRTALLIALFSPLAATAATSTLVSPVSDAGLAVVEARCPTFSWTSVSTRDGYELVVYHVSGPEDHVVVDPNSVLSKRLPGASNSWTPTMEACLASGERYAWSIRPLVGDGAGEWSKPALFAVAAAAAPVTLQQVIEALGRDPSNTGTTADRPAAAVPEGSEHRPAASAATTGGVSFEVDSAGNVSAASFSGSGAGLSNVAAVTATTATTANTANTAAALTSNPANCAAGQAPLGITSNGSAEGCYDVATQAELNTHKTSTDHDARYLRLTGGTLTGGLTISGAGINSFLSVQGPITSACPFVNATTKLDQVGSWCVDISAQAEATGSASMIACHDRGMSLCPLEAIITCDATNTGNPNLTSCGVATDTDGFIVRTFGHDGDGSGSAFSELLQYNGGGNVVSPVSDGTLLRYYCCRPLSGSAP